MPDIEHARHLLMLARRDLKPLPLLSDPAVADTEFFGFHVQQAVEKALKAWISLLDQDYPKTHDLAMLFKQIEDSGQAVQESFLELIDLTSFAVQYRYDSITILEGELNRLEAIRQVTDLVEHVETLLRSAEASRD